MEGILEALLLVRSHLYVWLLDVKYSSSFLHASRVANARRVALVQRINMLILKLGVRVLEINRNHE